MEVNNEILKKYDVPPYDVWMEGWSVYKNDADYDENYYTLEWYMLMLKQTDHIPNKIIEAQILGTEIDDYTEILNCRQFARDEINRLEAEVQ